MSAAAAIDAALARWLDNEPAAYVPIRDDILAALAAAGYVVERGWQPIESAPRDGTPVLISQSSTGSIRWAVFSGDWWRDGQATAGGRICGCPVPTHWRPLPDPPAAEPEAKETGDE